MIKIDLITGFLGAGKTTFIKEYAKYLKTKGLKIGILENDHGAVNVDMMLLKELEGENCQLEMVAGGCGEDCHKRRFKTKLIALYMSGLERVLVEPSGIFDMDEFFDVLCEEPLNRWYEIGNVIAVVDSRLEEGMSRQSEYLLASQIANAGKIVLSRCQEASAEEITNTLYHMNRALELFKCKRQIENEILCKPWNELTGEDYEDILKCGYVPADYVKEYSEGGGYQTIYFMNIRQPVDKICEKITTMMNDPECGNIFRIKGFMKQDNEEWIEINATSRGITVRPIAQGQEILIVIGESLNEDKIKF